MTDRRKRLRPTLIEGRAEHYRVAGATSGASSAGTTACASGSTLAWDAALLRDARRGLVVDLELDHAPDAHLGGAIEAERRQGTLHGLALGIEDARLGADENASESHGRLSA